MSKAIGGYVRHKDRRYEPGGLHLNPDAHLGKLRYSVMPSGAVITWRDEPPQFQASPSSLRFEPLRPAAGEFLHNMYGGGTDPKPGPPYTHTLTGPRPVLARNGNPLYWHPVRPYTLTVAG